MTFLLFNLLLLGIIFFLLILLSMVWPPDSPWAPWWRTSKKVAKRMCELAEISKKDTVYDLGCGDGEALLTAAKDFGAKGVGIEIDPLRAIITTLMIRINRVQSDIYVKRKNFFDEDLSSATIIFVYLVPKTLLRLKQKFLLELKPGTKIISYVYPIPYLPLIKEDRRKQIFIYQIPMRKTTGKKKT